MALDSTYTHIENGLADQLMQAAQASRDASQKRESEGGPRIVTRGLLSANPLKTNSFQKRAPTTDPALTDLLDRFVFDWYQATIPSAEGTSMYELDSDDERKAIIKAVEFCRAQGLHPSQITGGHNGYRAALPFLKDHKSKEVVCRIYSGSSQRLMPNIMITGGHGACATLAPALRAAFPGLRLSRADAALDVSQEGLWDALYDMAQKLSASIDKLGDVGFITAGKGRTFTLGSRKSEVFLRVYEKDFERYAKKEIELEDVDPNLVRIEWVFSPKSPKKKAMATKTPAEMIRTSSWAREFMTRAAVLLDVTDGYEKIFPERVEIERKEKTIESSVKHGVKQYGKSFARLAAANIVERDFDCRYDLAIVEPEDIIEEAGEILKEGLREAGIAVDVVISERLYEAQDPDAWRDTYVDEMYDHPARETRRKERAQLALASAACTGGCRVEIGGNHDTSAA